jgi:carbonic anhydrase/acetyltransferase-like protein (isoleucine patch superfamily)
MPQIRSFEGRTPRIDPTVWVDETALILGEVTLGPGSSIWPYCVLRGDIHRIEIGPETNVQDGAVLHVSHDSRFMPGGAPAILHGRITVGHQAVLHGCEVFDLCLIGIGARVLDRAVIEPHTILGAGALVPPGRRLEGGWLYVGTPARRSRALTDVELDYLEYSAANYVRLAERHRRSGPPAPAAGPAPRVESAGDSSNRSSPFGS